MRNTAAGGHAGHLSVWDKRGLTPAIEESKPTSIPTRPENPVSGLALRILAAVLIYIVAPIYVAVNFPPIPVEVPANYMA